MRIQKSDLSSAIESIKSIVSKKSTISAIQGILLKEGYLTATNHEITVKAKLENASDESFIIPQKAFDLIKNLPDGEMEISADAGHVVKIAFGSINNKFQSLSPELFNTGKESANENCYDMTVDSEELKECVRNVLYAVSKRNPGGKMGALCMSCKDGYLNFTGMDGHMLAWDRMAFHGDKCEVLIPRGTAEKLLQLDFVGEVQIKYRHSSTVFLTDKYIIETRIIDGTYFLYKKMFEDMLIHAAVDRKCLMDAVNRASMCFDTDSRIPIRLQFEADNIRIYLETKNAEYSEVVALLLIQDCLWKR